MIIFDTCVFSELSPLKPPSREADFLRRMPSREVHLSVIVFGEIEHGVRSMPPGRKRVALEAWHREILADHADRILDVDLSTARLWARLRVDLRAQGIQLSVADGLIAATALRHDASLVTRNVRDFEATGVRLINPWSDAP